MEFIHYDYRTGNKVRDEVKEILGDMLIENKDDEGTYYTIEISKVKLGGVIDKLTKDHDVMFTGNYMFIDTKNYKFRQR